MRWIKKIFYLPSYILSRIYAVGVFLHNAAAKPRSAGVSVVSVGNITAGGTGKTPLVIKILQKLTDVGKEKQAAVLSRGYGRRLKGYKVIKDIPSFDEAGDEVKIIKEKFPRIPVYVGGNRYKSARNAVKNGARILILDDGFQSREIKRNIDIVVIDATDPFGGGALLPAGRLREPLRNLKRADCVVINRSGQVEGRKISEIKKKIYNINKDISVFLSVEKLKEFKEIKGRRHAGPSHFKGKKILALSGIGNPEGFYNLLESSGLEIDKKFEFKDHYRWSDKELANIDGFVYRKGMIIITTQKDAARFNQKSKIKGWEAVMEVELKEDKKWQNYLKENI